MIVIKTSILTGKEHELEIDCTQEQLDEFASDSKTRPHIQAIFPNLNAYDSEYIMNGITKEEWNDAFGEVENE